MNQKYFARNEAANLRAFSKGSASERSENGAEVQGLNKTDLRVVGLEQTGTRASRRIWRASSSLEQNESKQRISIAFCVRYSVRHLRIWTERIKWRVSKSVNLKESVGTKFVMIKGQQLGTKSVIFLNISIFYILYKVNAKVNIHTKESNKKKIYP